MGCYQLINYLHSTVQLEKGRRLHHLRFYVCHKFDPARRHNFLGKCEINVTIFHPLSGGQTPRMLHFH